MLNKSVISILVISILDSSASSLEAADISLINLSTLATSFCITFISCVCSLIFFILPMVSDADLIDEIGFFNS